MESSLKREYLEEESAKQKYRRKTFQVERTAQSKAQWEKHSCRIQGSHPAFGHSRAATYSGEQEKVKWEQQPGLYVRFHLYQRHRKELPVPGPSQLFSSFWEGLLRATQELLATCCCKMKILVLTHCKCSTGTNCYLRKRCS